MKKMTKLLSVLTVVSVLFVLFSASVFAATPGFSYYGEGMGTKDLTYKVKQGADYTKKLFVENLDAERAITTKVDLIFKGQPAIDESWLSLSSDEVVVNPNEEKEFALNVSVPEGVEDGKYEGILMVTLINYDGNGNEEGAVKVNAAKAKKMYVVVDSLAEEEVVESMDEEESMEEDDKRVDEKEVEKTNDGEKESASLYNFFQQYLEIILLIIIGLLILKMYFMGKNCETKEKKSSSKSSKKAKKKK